MLVFTILFAENLSYGEFVSNKEYLKFLTVMLKCFTAYIGTLLEMFWIYYFLGSGAGSQIYLEPELEIQKRSSFSNAG